MRLQWYLDIHCQLQMGKDYHKKETETTIWMIIMYLGATISSACHSVKSLSFLYASINILAFVTVISNPGIYYWTSLNLPNIKKNEQIIHWNIYFVTYLWVFLYYHSFSFGFSTNCDRKLSHRLSQQNVKPDQFILE